MGCWLLISLDLMYNIIYPLIKISLQNSYAVHDIAVPGILNITLGLRPFQKAAYPASLYNALAAVLNPVTCLNVSFYDIPLVCKTVRTQSNGVVNAAAIPPAIPPLTQCKYGLYELFGLSSNELYS